MDYSSSVFSSGTRGMQKKDNFKRPPPFVDLSISGDFTTFDINDEEMLSYFDSDKNPLMDDSESAFKFGDTDTSEETRLNGQFINEETNQRRNRPARDLSSDDLFSSEFEYSPSPFDESYKTKDNEYMDSEARRDAERKAKKQQAEYDQAEWNKYLARRKVKQEEKMRKFKAAGYNPRKKLMANRDLLFIDDEDAENVHKRRRFGSNKYLEGTLKEKYNIKPHRNREREDPLKTKDVKFGHHKFFNEEEDDEKTFNPGNREELPFQKPPKSPPKTPSRFLVSDSDSSEPDFNIPPAPRHSPKKKVYKSKRKENNSDDYDSNKENPTPVRKRVVAARNDEDL